MKMINEKYTPITCWYRFDTMTISDSGIPYLKDVTGNLPPLELTQESIGFKVNADVKEEN